MTHLGTIWRSLIQTNTFTYFKGGHNNFLPHLTVGRYKAAGFFGKYGNDLLPQKCSTERKGVFSPFKWKVFFNSYDPQSKRPFSKKLSFCSMGILLHDI